MDWGLLEDGVFGLFTAISQPQALSPFYRWGNCGSERATDFPATTQQILVLSGTPPASVSLVASSQIPLLTSPPALDKAPIAQVPTASRKGWSHGGEL